MSSWRRTWIFTLLISAAAVRADAASLTLAWDPPPGSDVAGYIVWYGTAPGEYTSRLDVGATTSQRIEGLNDGTNYYFAVQAYNTAGEIGALSDEVFASSPGSVGGLPGGGSSGGGSDAGGSGGGGSTGGTGGENPNTGSGLTPSAPSGSIRDNRTLDIAWLPTQGAAAYRVELGAAAGHTAFSAVTADTSISFDLTDHPAATYYMRVRPIIAGVPAEASAEASVIATGIAGPVGPAAPMNDVCDVAPAPARQLVYTVNGSAVQLAWQPGRGRLPEEYLLEVGSRGGLQDLLLLPLAGASTGLSATAADGIYVVRLVSTNACGASPWAPEATVRVGAVGPTPGGAAPVASPALRHDVQGDVVTLSWSAPANSVVTRYVIEARTPFGAFTHDTQNRGTIFTNAGTPPGEYVITVRAGNTYGLGPASNAVRVIVR